MSWDATRQAEGERLCAAANTSSAQTAHDHVLILLGIWARNNVPDLFAAYREAQQEIAERDAQIVLGHRGQKSWTLESIAAAIRARGSR